MTPKLYDVTLYFTVQYNTIRCITLVTYYMNIHKYIYAGTRGALDFSEVPSHLFEHFARDPALIQAWARHHKVKRSLIDP